MTAPVVTIDLAEFDEIRARADKYKGVNQGLEGFMQFLHEEEKNSKDEKKTSLLGSTLIKAMKDYNATNPDHPFTI